jgi:hypothetical protein
MVIQRHLELRRDPGFRVPIVHARERSVRMPLEQGREKEGTRRPLFKNKRMQRLI